MLRRYAIMAIALGVGLAGVIGYEAASAGLPSGDGSIHACLQPQNGNIAKIVDPAGGGTCASNEVPLKWPPSGTLRLTSISSGTTRIYGPGFGGSLADGQWHTKDVAQDCDDVQAGGNLSIDVQSKGWIEFSTGEFRPVVLTRHFSDDPVPGSIYLQAHFRLIIDQDVPSDGWADLHYEVTCAKYIAPESKTSPWWPQ